HDVEKEIEKKELVQAINRFLDTLPVPERRVFLARYWYMDSIQDIATHFKFSHSKVMSMLFRTRNKLRRQLEKEGYL
ncbi:MAG: RNA polymerase subunit sigma-70, partial [Firmicutes bacterium]|nr:RNA polymerase subunit sigma-70 [Bacillota bacterium]